MSVPKLTRNMSIQRRTFRYSSVSDDARTSDPELFLNFRIQNGYAELLTKVYLEFSSILDLF